MTEFKDNPGYFEQTGTPKELMTFIKKSESKPSWAQGSVTTKSRLELLI